MIGRGWRFPKRESREGEVERKGALRPVRPDLKTNIIESGL